MKDNYQDIINLEHYELKNPRMSRYNRAAQFAPFAALTGYYEKVKEVARLTNKKIELDDALKELINCKLNQLNKVIKLKPEVEVTYFVPDIKKDGGEYLTKKGHIKRIDFVNRFLKFTDNKKIIIDEIISIKEEITKVE
ncbi:MAG: YolD-like family protein [Bacilli bacterium]|nr:YolD-like family protein [Bacilli bacterium]